MSLGNLEHKIKLKKERKKIPHHSQINSTQAKTAFYQPFRSSLTDLHSTEKKTNQQTNPFGAKALQSIPGTPLKSSKSSPV